MAISEHRVLEILNQFKAPGSPATLVESGAIREIAVEGERVHLVFSVPAPEKAAAEKLRAELEKALLAEAGVSEADISVQVHLPTFSTAPRAPEPPPRNAWAGNLKKVRHVIAVASGKGGVGKSTVSTNLAVALAQAGASVGLLDGDIYGPSQQMMTGAAGNPQGTAEGKIIPIRAPGGISVMSLGFIVDTDQPVIWRGPLLMKALEQLISDVVWGELDYLIIDLPPGTGDIALSLAQNVPLSGSVIVTTPQAVAITDVRKSIDFARRVELPVLGVIENMSGFVCPECGKRSDVFGAGGGEEMASDMGVPFLGRIPVDPVLVTSGDAGGLGSYVSGDTAGAKSFRDVVDALTAIVEDAGTSD